MELLIVMGVILTLMALLFAGGLKWRQKAMEDSTTAFIKDLELRIQEYHSIMGRYPPDGLDSEVLSFESQEPLQSGAALAHALGTPLLRREVQPSGVIKEVQDTEPLYRFKQDQLFYKDEDPDEYPDVFELIDPWGNAFHYDNLAKGEEWYSEQSDDTVHLQFCEAHGDDPREIEGEGVDTAGGQNMRKFDIWSHGANGHTEKELITESLCNWTRALEGKTE